MCMEVSGWRRLGEALAVLGLVFLAGGIAAYAGNSHQYVAVLIVFGGIFMVIGVGLVAITFLDKNTS